MSKSILISQNLHTKTKAYATSQLVSFEAIKIMNSEDIFVATFHIWLLVRGSNVFYEFHAVCKWTLLKNNSFADAIIH